MDELSALSYVVSTGGKVMDVSIEYDSNNIYSYNSPFLTTSQTNFRTYPLDRMQCRYANIKIPVDILIGLVDAHYNRLWTEEQSAKLKSKKENLYKTDPYYKDLVDQINTYYALKTEE